MINFYRATLLTVAITAAYCTWSLAVQLVPLVEPIRSALVTGEQTCRVFNEQAKPAVNAVEEATSAINNFKFPIWFRHGSATIEPAYGEITPLTDEEFAELQRQLKSQGYGKSQWERWNEPEPTLNPDAWVNQYVDRQHELMRGGADRPTRREVRQAVRSAFPAMSLLMIMYYVFMILLLL